MPAAVVTFSAGLDMTRTGDGMDSKVAVDPFFTRAGFVASGDRYMAGHDPRHPLLSPATTADLTGLPPLLLQVGTDEMLLADSTRLARRAWRAGVDVILDVTADVPHVFQAFTGILDEADQALDRAAHFLAQHLASSALTAVGDGGAEPRRLGRDPARLRQVEWMQLRAEAEPRRHHALEPTREADAQLGLGGVGAREAVHRRELPVLARVGGVERAPQRLERHRLLEADRLVPRHLKQRRQRRPAGRLARCGDRDAERGELIGELGALRQPDRRDEQRRPDAIRARGRSGDGRVEPCEAIAQRRDVVARRIVIEGDHGHGVRRWFARTLYAFVHARQ